MKLLFLSNFFNHHQKALSDSLCQLCETYLFIATKEMDAERLAMGWGQEALPEYVVDYHAQRERCDRAIETFDVVLYGDAPFELVQRRLERGRLVFVYSERIFKKGLFYWRNLRYIPIHMGRFFGRRNCWLLSASAYGAGDFALIGCFRDKALKWGYFPQHRVYDDMDAVLREKRPGSLLWVSRMIPLKHPEACLSLARQLRQAGYDFHLDMIGIGPLEAQVRSRIQADGLQERVTLLGAMSPEDVLEHMRRSEVFLFTSDRNEGWGAVLNESMNAGCAVVVSSAAGSARFLVRDGENGMIYPSGRQRYLYEKVARLMDDDGLRRRLGRSAYDTITRRWNAPHAAETLVRVAQGLLEGKGLQYEPDGPCSRAERIYMI